MTQGEPDLTLARMAQFKAEAQAKHRAEMERMANTQAELSQLSQTSYHGPSGLGSVSVPQEYCRTHAIRDELETLESRLTNVLVRLETLAERLYGPQLQPCDKATETSPPGGVLERIDRTIQMLHGRAAALDEVVIKLEHLA